MLVKDVKAVLKPLSNLFEIGRVFVLSIPTERYDNKYNNFEDFLKDTSIDELEVSEDGNPVDFDVRGFRFIDEIDVWVKEVQE